MPNELYTIRRAAVALTLGAVLAACGGEGGSSEVGGKGKDLPGDTTGAAPAEAGQPQSAAPAPKGPTGPVANLPPNEMGRIMVLEYHRTGSPKASSSARWRTSARTWRSCTSAATGP
jgi:hypothetical protein